MIVVLQSMCAQRSGRLNKFMSCINLGGMQQVQYAGFVEWD